jgi:crotonobetainyl-CoA:carnitine CoA-transferase CaiB-like acyl-CoA transferase
VRVGVSIGDSLAALHGVVGIMMALRQREQNKGEGQYIDVALYESVFNMMESLLPEYSAFGAIREPAGSSLPGITPSNAYVCKDGKYALIAGNGDSIFKRLMNAIGRADMAENPDYAHNDGRARNAGVIDAAIGHWASALELDKVLEILDQAGVPAGRVYDIADIAADPHYQARDMLLDSNLPDGTLLKVPGIVPKLSSTPGGIYRLAPHLGQDTEDILNTLGISAEQQADWQARGLIAKNPKRQ